MTDQKNQSPAPAEFTGTPTSNLCPKDPATGDDTLQFRLGGDVKKLKKGDLIVVVNSGKKTKGAIVRLFGGNIVVINPNSKGN